MKIKPKLNIALRLLKWSACLMRPKTRLALLVENYEAKHYPMDAPDPVDFLLYIVENRGLVRKDLEPFMGNRGRVSEVLNRTRPLSLTMIRLLSEGLKISAALLIQPYELRKAA